MPQSRDDARFVFEGTVQTPKSATFAAVTDKKDTSIVRVDRILRAPDPVTDFAGRRITVRAPDGRKFSTGEQGTFYTNVWLLGEGLAVELLDYEPAQAGAAAAAAAAPGAAPTTGDAVENFKRHELKSRVDSADAVVSGRVTAVRFVEDDAAAPPLAGAAAAAAAPQTTRISEHTPIWQEATVQIDQVHKGSHAAPTATVRFPASSDVRWYRAPKLTPGQEGLFVLHSGAQAGAPAAATAAAAAGPQTYTVLDSADFQPMDRAPQVAAMVAAAQAAPGARRSSRSRKKSARKAKPAKRAKAKRDVKRAGAKRGAAKSARRSRRRRKST